VWTKLLARKPDERFPTALDAAEAIGAICAPPAPPARRGWIVPATLGALVAVVAVIALKKPAPEATGTVSTNEPLRAVEPGGSGPALAPAPRAVLRRGVLPMSAEEALDLQKNWADHLRQPVVVPNTLGMNLALVPPGEFAMSGLYSVAITRPYRIGTTEVTFHQYDQFVKATGHQTAAEKRKVGARFRTWRPLGEFPFPQDPVHRLSPGWGKYTDDQPIGYLTWNDVDAFLGWLSAKEARTYRLPTHAEWVWACRAGTSSGLYWDRGTGRAFAEAGKYAWTRSAGADRPKPVGTLLPNAWGLHDTIGNVEELVSDYVAIGFTPSGNNVPDPTGPPKGDNRLTCGASYHDVLRVASASELTGSSAKNVVYSNQGFRVVLEP
jgi:formylglycine-generating enzyme required for sulfatase activity